jgi:hypothetical protein
VLTLCNTVHCKGSRSARQTWAAVRGSVLTSVNTVHSQGRCKRKNSMGSCARGSERAPLQHSACKRCCKEREQTWQLCQDQSADSSATRTAKNAKKPKQTWAAVPEDQSTDLCNSALQRNAARSAKQHEACQRIRVTLQHNAKEDAASAQQRWQLCQDQELTPLQPECTKQR